MSDSLKPGVLGGVLQTSDSLPQRAYVRIRKAMFKGDLPPGLPISEPQLSAELGLSRAALRESLVRLETEGYVMRTENGRWQVADMSLTDAEEIYQCRAVLEGLAARLAAVRVSEDLLQEMGTCLQAAKKSYEEGDIDQAVLESTRFHDLLLIGSSNARLERQLDMLRPQLFRNRVLMLNHQTRKADFLDQNQQILDALVEGDADTAETLARASASDDLEAIRALFDLGILIGTSRGEQILSVD